MPADRLETAVTRMLGIRYPIVVAPMFLVSNPALLEAAARAGAVGAVPALNFRTTEAFAAFLHAFPEGLVFGVNLILKWSERLEADLAATVDRKVPLVITSLGDPTRVVEAVHGYGGKVWSDVVSLRHAEKAARAGADALVAVASGAGGHAGGLSPLILAPWLKAQVGLPVLMAGGMAHGGHLLAALGMGAEGGYFGTRFIATIESGASDAYKAELLRAEPEDLELTAEVTGVPASFLSSSLAEFRKGEGKAWKNVWSAGQSVAFVNDIPPAGELVARIVREYEAARQRLPALA